MFDIFQMLEVEEAADFRENLKRDFDFGNQPDARR
jgi:hypothetical protein